MIKNERQYRVTLAERDRLNDHLRAPVADDVPSWVRTATINALTSQILELDEALADYKALQAGTQLAAEPVAELAALPQALIRSRIAAGMTQRELADRIGVREQQIQRYEADDYAGANLTRLQAVVDALNVDFDATLTLPDSGTPAADLRRALRSLGLSSKTLSRRFFVTLDAATPSPEDWMGAASRASRIFGVDVDSLLRGQVAAVANVGRFRASSAANVHQLNGYARYAEYLGGLLRRACVNDYRPLPAADQIRDALGSRLRTAPLEALLEVCWDHGVPVLPLADQGAFYGACWTTDEGPVIALKNSVRSPERWALLLAHEMDHTMHPEDESVLEADLEIREWRETPMERRADEFASDVLLGPSAEAMIQVAVREADSDIARLKAVLPDVAEAGSVSTGVLADHMAFRMGQQGLAWWPVARRLHTNDQDAWKTARSTLFRYVDLTRLDPLDQEILIDGIAP